MKKVYCFFHEIGNCQIKYIVLGYLDTYFVKNHSDVLTKYSEVDVIKMLEFLSTIFTWSLAKKLFSKLLVFQWAHTVPLTRRFISGGVYTRTLKSLITEKQTTKFSSANFQKMLSPSYIILRI